MSNASLTPAGGWYADPMDAAQLRWWDGVNWTPQTTPATAASGSAPFDEAEPLAPVTPIAPEAPAPEAPAPVPAAAAPLVDGPSIYIPRNSVFKMAEAVDGQAYSPEWSGFADISDEVALSGVPVQLALTATPSEGPPIPISADAFPILGFAPESVVAEPVAPAWRVEEPLAKPIDQLFPVAGPPAPTASIPTASIPVGPIPANIPAPAPAAAFSIAVAHAPGPLTDGPTLSPDIFPSTAPASALTAAPAPTGALFPGLVPNTPEPVAVEQAAPVPVLAAVPDLVEIEEPVAAAPAADGAVLEVPLAEAPVAEAPVAEVPVAEAPVAEAPLAAAATAVAPVVEALVVETPVVEAPAVEHVVEPEPAPAPEPAPQPQPELYAGPAAVAAPAPVPTPFDAPAPMLGAPVLDPAAAPGAGYEPLVARAIPQPVLLEVPVDVPAPVAVPTVVAPISEPFATFTTASVTPTAAPETVWPTEGTYQPHPGSYVPYDPNAMHLQEQVPAIPFSSRDPYNPASTSRPALRSYGAAPVGPNGSTYTPALTIILLTPLLMAGGYALLFQLAAINVGLAPNLALAALLGALFFVGIGAAQFDRNTLAKRGYFDLASPFWILLSPLVYLGVRASRLHSQGSGGIRAVFLLFAAWAGALAILAFSTFAALTTVTPDRIAQTEQSVAQKFVLEKVVPKVECPSIPSFAAGTVFNCTATSGGTVQLVQVTITDWIGGQSYKLVSNTTTPAATAPTAP